MSSQLLKQVAIAGVIVGAVAWGTGVPVQAAEQQAAGRGVFTIKHKSVPVHESMFRDAIVDARRRSELTQPDMQQELFRASAASSTRALDWTFGWEELDTPRHLVLRYWDRPTLSRSTPSDTYDTVATFREAAHLMSAY